MHNEMEREQGYYVAHSIAGMATVLTEPQLTVNLREKRTYKSYIVKQSRSIFNKCVIALRVLE